MRNLFPRVATHCGTVLVSVCVCGSPPFLAILQVFRHFFIACHKLMCWKSWVMMKTSSLQLGLASELISRTAISLVRKVMDCISRISLHLDVKKGTPSRYLHRKIGIAAH